jgi:hypothetical protein
MPDATLGAAAERLGSAGRGGLGQQSHSCERLHYRQRMRLSRAGYETPRRSTGPPVASNTGEAWWWAT